MSIIEDYSVRTGAIRNRDLAYLLCSDDEHKDSDIPHTLIFTRHQSQWGQFLLKWAALSVCVAKAPKEQMVAVSEHGHVSIIGSGEQNEEMIIDGKNSPEIRGPLREVRNIGGKAYAVGMDRQVYRRDAPGKWACIDVSMRKIKAPDDVFGFESIHGFNEDEIYAVGWHGEVFTYNGKKWSKIESPTNLILTRVFCAPDGNVYACGQSGVLLRGRHNQWDLIEHDSTDSDLWDLHYFQGRLYLSTTRQVFTLVEDRLELVDAGDEIPSTCYHLDAEDGVLWSIGAKDVLQFDGKEWTRIL